MNTVAQILLLVFILAMVVGLIPNFINDPSDKKVVVGVARLFEWATMALGVVLAIKEIS